MRARVPSHTGKVPLPSIARRRIPGAVVAAVVASTLGAAPVAAQGRGPEWPQFQGGPGHPGVLGEGPAPPYRVRWTFPAPDGASLSGAVIVDGVAITLGVEAVYAVDVSNGDLVWQVPREGGPLSVPAVASGRPRTLLYLEGPRAEATASPTASPATGSPTGDEDEASDEGSSLVALDLADRAELWRVRLGAIARSGVTVDGDTAYVGDQAGTLHAIAVADGAVRWTSDLREQAGGAADGGCGRLTDARIEVPVAVADGRVVAVGRNAAGGIVAVSSHEQASGECVWREFPQIGSAVSSVAAADDGIVVVAFADRLVRALSSEDGQVRWASLALRLFSPVTSPALGSDSLFVADLGGGLYRFDPEEGSRVWGYQFDEAVVRSSPVVSGSAVLLGLNDGRLVAVDAASGRLVWQGSASRGLIGTMALSDDAVVAVKGGSDGGLIAFEHDPEGSLVDVPSPTEFDAGSTLPRIALAGAVALLAVLVPAMALRRRFGDALPSDASEVQTGQGDEE